MGVVNEKPLIRLSAGFDGVADGTTTTLHLKQLVEFLNA
jgi:hypothetical protein